MDPKQPLRYCPARMADKVFALGLALSGLTAACLLSPFVSLTPLTTGLCWLLGAVTGGAGIASIIERH